MTIQDRREFVQCVRSLALAVRLPADDISGEMLNVYFDGLMAFPLDAVKDAAKELASAEWFPKLGEWQSVASKARNGRLIAAALPDPGRGWSSECGTCDDTGWEELQCDGTTFRPCGRSREHLPHDYVIACACRPTNKTYQRKRAEERERASSRAKAAKSNTRTGGFTRVGDA